MRPSGKSTAPSAAPNSSSPSRRFMSKGIRWQLEPHFPPFVAREAPQFIGLGPFPPLALGVGRAQAVAVAARGAPLFYPFGNRHVCHPREPNNAALRVAPAQQGVDLRVVGGSARCRSGQALVAARRTTGTWAGLFYCRCDESPRCRIWRKNVTYKSFAFTRHAPPIDHRPMLFSPNLPPAGRC